MPDKSTQQGAQPLERRLATILCADVADYSKMMAANEERTVRIFRGHREIFESLVNLHRGRIFNTAGDALLVEFNSPVEAVRCATEIQAALRTRNEHLAPEEKMQFRMGINVGDVIIQGGDLLGDGVNVAARIQTATAPGGICISGSVHDQIQNKLSLDFKPLGEQTYKNIAKPVRTYTICEGAAVTTPVRRTRLRVLAAITAAVLAGAAYWGYQQYDAHRTEQLRVDAGLAAQLAEQKHATEEARREAQLQAQKLATEEGLRRTQEERLRVEQDRKLLETERRAAEAARLKAADEALRHAQEERALLEQERRRLETQRQAIAAAGKQVNAGQPASTATKGAPKLSASHDGTYNGRLCNQFPNKEPSCWPVVLQLRNGIAEGSWISSTQKTSSARGTVAADGSLRLNLAAWHPKNRTPVEAVLLGGVVEGAITASGEWGGGGKVAGEWHRTQIATAASATKGASKLSAAHDGTYNGQLCNQYRSKAPFCWPIALRVRNGIAEGS